MPTNNVTNTTEVDIVRPLPIAKVGQVGVVKPDGTSTQTDADGTLHVIGSFTQQQSDWGETNNALVTFIKNKSLFGFITPGANTTFSGAGTLASPYVISSTGGINQLTGDATAGPGSGSQPLTLVPSGVIASTYGDGLHVPQFDVDSKGRITGARNIPISGGGGGVATSFPTTTALGIVPGPDETGTLNTAFLNANYKGIILDNLGGGAIKILGTVNCQGKEVIIYPGTYFTGGGTLSNAIIQAISYTQMIMDTTITLSNCKTGTSDFSVFFYGAHGDGSTDDQPYLQKTSDMMIVNTGMTRRLRIPGGFTYATHSPWILYKLSGGEYATWNLNVIGEENIQNANDSSTPVIKPNFNNTFCIGVQFAAGGYIKGLSIEGTFTTSLSQVAFYQTNWAAISTARDSQYSPNAGICIDPFSGASVIPPDGGYPGLTSWYQGSAVRSGSTDFHIYQTRVQGFTVNVMNTPNGYTQQGEDCGIHDCDFNLCNFGVSYGNTQTDHTMIEDIRAWYYLYTVVDNFNYGNASISVGGTLGRINGMNIAGVVKTLFNIQIAQKNLSVKNVYCENLYAVGTLSSVHAEVTAESCHFNFAYLNIRPQLHGTCNYMKWTGSSFKYFDDQYNKSVWFGGGTNVTFEHCYFDQPPIIVNPYNNSDSVKFVDCPCFDPNVANTCIIGFHNSSYRISNTIMSPAIIGNFKIQDYYGLDDSTHPNGGTQNIPDATATFTYNNSTFRRYLRSIAVSVTITPDATLRTATFTTTVPNQCRNYDYCLDAATGNILGRITNISGSAITISEIPDNISAGTFTVDLVYWLTVSRPFMGDTASSSPIVSNIVPVLNAPYVAVGDRIDHPAFPLGTYIVSYNNGTRQATMSTNANANLTRQMFANGNPKEEVRSTRAPIDGAYSSYVFGVLPGTVWTELPNSISLSVGVPTTWYFTKGGTLNTTSYFANAGANKADFNISPPLRVVAGNIQAYDTYADSWSNV